MKRVAPAAVSTALFIYCQTFLFDRQSFVSFLVNSSEATEEAGWIFITDH